MSSLKVFLDAVLRVLFGHNAVDNTEDWKEAHDKASNSRAEVERIIRESEHHQ